MMRKMNPKRGFFNLFLCFVIFCIVSGIGVMAKFGKRVPKVRQQIEETVKLNQKIKQSADGQEEMSQWKDERRCEIKHSIAGVEWKKLIGFTKSDYVFIGCIILIFWIILGVYWLYTTVCVLSKAWEVGANVWIFGALTLVTNLFGAVCLWLYIKIHHVCPECGKLQPRTANNCAVCGAAIYIKCPDCGRRISVRDKYCNGCGRKMHRKEE